MNITQCKRIARLMQKAGFYGISIVLEYPEMSYRVTAFNRAGMARTVSSMSEWLDLAKESAR